jgi:hypothetical protein
LLLLLGDDDDDDDDDDGKGGMEILVTERKKKLGDRDYRFAVMMLSTNRKIEIAGFSKDREFGNYR